LLGGTAKRWRDGGAVWRRVACRRLAFRAEPRCEGVAWPFDLPALRAEDFFAAFMARQHPDYHGLPKSGESRKGPLTAQWKSPLQAAGWRIWTLPRGARLHEPLLVRRGGAFDTMLRVAEPRSCPGLIGGSVQMHPQPVRRLASGLAELLATHSPG
jgi:hypothetical protein